MNVGQEKKLDTGCIEGASYMFVWAIILPNSSLMDLHFNKYVFLHLGVILKLMFVGASRGALLTPERSPVSGYLDSQLLLGKIED